MSPYIIIIVIIILIIGWVALYYYKHGKTPSTLSEAFGSIAKATAKRYEEYTKTPVQLYGNTIGYSNDTLVKKIFDKAIKREKMYSENPKISDKNYSDAVENAFVIGDIYRYHIANNIDDNAVPLRAASQYYNTALERLAARPQLLRNPEFIVDRVEDFTHDDYTELRNDLIEARRLNARETAQRAVHITDVPYTIRPVPTTDEHLYGTTIVNQAERDIYYDVQEVRNDPQNVHDTNIVHELRKKYEKIAEYNSGKDNFPEIRKGVDGSNLSDDNKRRAHYTINTMSNMNYVTSMDTNETAILNSVWDRIMSKDNTTNRENLQNALYIALAECMEKNWQGVDQQVCTTGRISRVIESLVLNDKDPEISKPAATTEILRNEVFAKSYAIIQKELKSAEPDVLRAYNGLPGESSPDLEERLEIFENHLKTKIEETLRNEYTSVKPDVLNKLIVEAQGGV